MRELGGGYALGAGAGASSDLCIVLNGGSIICGLFYVYYILIKDKS